MHRAPHATSLPSLLYEDKSVGKHLAKSPISLFGETSQLSCESVSTLLVVLVSLVPQAFVSLIPLISLVALASSG